MAGQPTPQGHVPPSEIRVLIAGLIKGNQLLGVSPTINQYPLVNYQQLAIVIFLCLIGNTSSFRVHFPASYVSLTVVETAPGSTPQLHPSPRARQLAGGRHL